MTRLFLKYKTDSEEVRQALVDRESYTVGRHSSSDLCIPDGRLSRRHLHIERYEDEYVVSDAGSSNGSTLNGEPLDMPKALKHADVIGLGGFFLVAAFETKEKAAAPAIADVGAAVPVPTEADAEGASIETPDAAVPDAPSVSAPVGDVSAAAAASGGSGSMLWYILVPAFALVILLFGGAVVYLLVSKPSKPTYTASQADDEDLYGDRGRKTDRNDAPTGGNTANSKDRDADLPGSQSGNSTTPGSPTLPPTGPTGPPSNLSQTAKIEENGSKFLRQIAQNNPRAFLTGDQAKQLESKVKSFSGSSSLGDNLKSAQKNAAALKSLDANKNLKPQKVAVAEISKLGSNSGDVLQTAQSMIEVLGKLSTQLGSELADDSLLVLAAYGQGSSGEFMRMRNMLQDLANKSSQSSREVRSIWFLQKNGKITQAEFDNAFNFLAIGTIAQNPKEFGVNAEALSL